LFDCFAVSYQSTQEAAGLSSAALSTIENIATAATTPRSGSKKPFSVSWEELPGHLLRRAVNALAAEQGSSASLAGKIAMRVACALSRGSYLSAKAVVDVILPILLGKGIYTYTNFHTVENRSLIILKQKHKKHYRPFGK
jgi:hypothetical protein